MTEALLTHPKGGAVGYVGNTRFSRIGVGDDFQRAFFHRLASTRHLGPLNDSRVSVFGSTGYSRGYERWQIFSLNLLGDPELRVFRGPFPRLVLDQSQLGRRRIRVETAQAPPLGPPAPGERVPVSDALVHLRTGNEEFNLHTDAEGYACVPEHAIGHD